MPSKYYLSFRIASLCGKAGLRFGISVTDQYIVRQQLPPCCGSNAFSDQPGLIITALSLFSSVKRHRNQDKPPGAIRFHIGVLGTASVAVSEIFSQFLAKVAKVMIF